MCTIPTGRCLAIPRRMARLIEWSPPQVYRGSLSPKVLKKVMEWAGLHPTELDDDWQRARSGLPLQPIPPLP